MNVRPNRLPLWEWYLLLVLLALGLIIRLIEISQPFVDQWSWRQADVAMIAENLYRHGFNIFYPEINWAGPAGYVGTEFPLVSLIAAGLYVLFGVQDWIGRGVSIGFFLISVPFFFLLVRKIFGAASGFFAVAIYTLAPLSIFASRSFMPDMAALSLSIIALHLFAVWLEDNTRITTFIALTLVTCLALLTKITMIIMGLPLLYMAWQAHRGKRLARRPFWIFMAVSLTIPLIWYAHAFRISQTYYPYHFFGEDGLAIKDLAWYGEILSYIVTWGLTPPLVVAMLLGLLIPAHRPFGHLFHWWLIAMILFIVLVGYGNRHPWYQLPLIPVAAAFGGRVCAAGVRQLTHYRPGYTLPIIACLAFLGGTAGLAYFRLQPLYDPWAIPLWQAGRELDRLAAPEALVMAADGGDPSLIYYSRRKGWHFPEIAFHQHDPISSEEAIRELEERRRSGAQYLALTAYTLRWLETYPVFRAHLEARYPRVRETKEYLIFDLTAAQTE